jgi:hypothetical protein
LWGRGEEKGMVKEGPCRHCGVTSESSCSSVKQFFILPVVVSLLILHLLSLCSSASYILRVVVSSNYASGKRVLEEIFRVPRTRMPNLACSLWIEIGLLFGGY